MILLECSPPFQWKPSYWRGGTIRRWMWGWFAVAWVPYDLNDFVEETAQAGITLHKRGELQHRADGALTAAKQSDD